MEYIEYKVENLKKKIENKFKNIDDFSKRF